MKPLPCSCCGRLTQLYCERCIAIVCSVCSTIIGTRIQERLCPACLYAAQQRQQERTAQQEPRETHGGWLAAQKAVRS